MGLFSHDPTKGTLKRHRKTAPAAGRTGVKESLENDRDAENVRKAPVDFDELSGGITGGAPPLDLRGKSSWNAPRPEEKTFRLHWWTWILAACAIFGVIGALHEIDRLGAAQAAAPLPIAASAVGTAEPEAVPVTEIETTAAVSEPETTAAAQTTSAAPETEKPAETSAAAETASAVPVAETEAAPETTAATTASAAQAEPAQAEEQMVWISKTGKRYHSNPACSGMNQPSHVPLSTARAMGLTPCKRCY